MPEKQEHPPLRFWIGLHRDGSGRQCIVDFHGGPMEGVKQSWSEKNEGRLTTMETVIQPEFDRGEVATLELYKRMENLLGDPRLPALEALLRKVAMTAYESGLQQGALKREVDRG